MFIIKDHYMVQYSAWPNCNNNCKFCLRKNREVWNKDRLLQEIKKIMPNIILRVEKQEDKIIKSDEICCYCLSADLPKTSLPRLRL